jgi:hypothetical protein
MHTDAASAATASLATVISLRIPLQSSTGF